MWAVILLLHQGFLREKLMVNMDVDEKLQSSLKKDDPLWSQRLEFWRGKSRDWCEPCCEESRGKLLMSSIDLTVDLHIEASCFSMGWCACLLAAALDHDRRLWIRIKELLWEFWGYKIEDIGYENETNSIDNESAYKRRCRGNPLVSGWSKSGFVTWDSL